MLDYANYFIDKKPSEKQGVSIHRDIDWWMHYIAARIAKLLFLIVIGLFLLGVKSAITLSADKHQFPIRHINLIGEVSITQPEAISKVLVPFKQASYYSLNLYQVSEKMLSLPWIKSLTLSRYWPDTLNIYLSERQPAYRWGNKELLDSTGVRFAKPGHLSFTQLPQLFGTPGNERKMIAAYQQLVQNLGAESKNIAIKSLILNQYLSWELHLQSGVVVKFGRSDYQTRMKRFADAYLAHKLPSFPQVSDLDFRYDHGFAAKWKPAFSPYRQQPAVVLTSTVGI